MEQEFCEAKYGNKRCNNKAVSSVIVSNKIFRCCKECGKLARKQIKLNNQ